MSADISEPGHGNSPAAWIAVTIMLVGFLIGTVAFWLALPGLVIACGGVILAGLIVGWVLARLGYGVDGSKWAQR
jgi:uncharacterized RDD family membrane protein YckC